MTVYTLHTQRQVHTVTELTRLVRLQLEGRFPAVWVEGEITNFKRHTSGHLYFSLKDEESQLGCVMFRRENSRLDFEPEEGLAVLCHGRVSVYAPRGQYQLYVERIEPKGMGALQLRFRQLRDKLAAEGLFDESRKRPIPFLPGRVGIVTSIDGAALHDILSVLGRRYPDAHVSVYPVPVQGEAAAPAIAEAIEDFNRWEAADVLIVGRGGGSLEDLWAFNEEAVARAIAGSRIPVISAVGHEVDYTIADFVADLRAPTPSAAAELVLPPKDELVARVAELGSRAAQALLGRIRTLRLELGSLLQSRGLKQPLSIFDGQAQRIDELRRSLGAGMGARLALGRERVAGLAGQLEALGPLGTLRRGFSVTQAWPEGRVVTSVEGLGPGALLRTRLAEGYVYSQVTETRTASEEPR